tara:strand:+ start:6226 stop:7122 length:897 start_codon:yes stop_codon:yes gene_type:complete
MNKLANKGRFGDTKIRNIDGSPAHVNNMEASLYDRLGKSLATPIIKSMGAGTTNPSTGLKEYHGSAIGGWKKSHWPAGHPAHHSSIVEGLQDIYDSVDTIFGGNLPGGTPPILSSTWDDDAADFWFGENSVAGHVLPLHGSGWFTSGDSDETRLERQAEGLLQTGTADLARRAQRVLGPGGELEQETQFQIDDQTTDFRRNYQDLRTSTDQAISQSNLAFSGTANNLSRDNMKRMQQDYETSLERIEFGKKQQEQALLDQARKERTQLFMDYTSATGKPADSMANPFDSWLQNYEGDV